MEALLLYLSLFLLALPSLCASQCRARDLGLPVQHHGVKLPPSSDSDGSSTCSNDGPLTQQALEQLNDDVNSLIDSVLPDIQDYLSPVPCEGVGWTKVVFLDMKNASHTCPSSLELFETDGKRSCRLPGSHPDGCLSLVYSTSDVMYDRVCGSIIGLQYGITAGFNEYHQNPSLTIDDTFVDGVVVTRGSPREHIWTFAAGLDEANSNENFVCPCLRNSGNNPPRFLGNNFFCESGVVEYTVQPGSAPVPMLFPDDPLWDGQGCRSGNSCCERNFPPYFTATLDQPSCDDIEVRVCVSDSTSRENIHIEKMELYVK